MDRSDSKHGRAVDWILIGVLLVFAAGVHAWQIHQTAVIARDGVGFMRYAWQLESRPWDEVLRENPHPPGYPLLILAVSIPVRQSFSGIDSELMQLSAQLANALAGVLLVIPMYLLGRAVFDRRVGFGAAFLFQCLPVASRAMADALTEGTYLLFLATALLFAIEAIRSGSVVGFGLSGLFGGLAYLTRPEGVLVILATGLVLFGLQLRATARRPWRRVLVCGLTLAAASLIVASPYMLTIGHFTNKTTGRNILQAAHEEFPSEQLSVSGLSTGLPLATLPLAVFGPESRDLPLLQRNLWCIGVIFEEVVKGYHYVGWLPALVGIWWLRGNAKRVPGGLAMLALMVLNFFVLWRVAYVEAYVAERHSLTIVMCSIFRCVAMLLVIGELLAALARRFSPQRPALANGSVWAWVLVGALALSGLPKSLAPLHPNRTGFHAAGVWLAENAKPTDYIIDPFSWVEFYSGQVHRQVATTSNAHDSANVYVVLGGTKNEHERLPLIPEAKSWAQRGQVVFRWPDHPINFKAESVIVYRVP